MISILNGLLIFGIIQVFVFSGLLISKKERNTSDLIMITWLLSFAVHSFLILVNANTSSLILQVIPINFTLLYGPFLWLYVKEIMEKDKCLNNQKMLHFVPFIIFIILSIIFYKSNILLKLLAFSGLVSGILYCILTYKQLNTHTKQIVNNFSNIEKINLDWIKKMLWGLTVIWIGVFFVVFISRFLSVKLPMNWFFMFIPLLISYLGYYGLKQQIISVKPTIELSKKESASQQKQPTYKAQQTYKKSGLQKQDMFSIYNTLENLMQTQQLYLQPTLSLKELSEKSNIPQHHITQTLNNYASVNFYDYINAYRIATFKQKIQQGEAENFSLLGIALDCGFNSKSSFNRIFKNSTGKSPSEYKKSIN